MGNLKVLSASCIAANPCAFFIGANHHQQFRLAIWALMVYTVGRSYRCFWKLISSSNQLRTHDWFWCIITETMATHSRIIAICSLHINPNMHIIPCQRTHAWPHSENASSRDEAYGDVGLASWTAARPTLIPRHSVILFWTSSSSPLDSSSVLSPPLPVLNSDAICVSLLLFLQPSCL